MLLSCVVQNLVCSSVWVEVEARIFSLSQPALGDVKSNFEEIGTYFSLVASTFGWRPVKGVRYISNGVTLCFPAVQSKAPEPEEYNKAMLGSAISVLCTLPESAHTDDRNTLALDMLPLYHHPRLGMVQPLGALDILCTLSLSSRSASPVYTTPIWRHRVDSNRLGL